MHHTKAKADIGLAKVIADLTFNGHVPCIPLSEHQPYDLVAILKNGKAVKLQVKYSRLKKNGVIDIKLSTGWVDRHGFHSRRYHENQFDYYALYCPEKELVLYIPNTVNCPTVVRFDRTSNNQQKHVKWAKAYRKLK